MAFIVPTVAEFKAEFDRDFPYGTVDTTVKDSDITKAIRFAGTNINEAIFVDQAEYTMCYLYLAAHHLVTNLQASALGTAANFNWLTESKSVGEVAETYVIPAWIRENKLLGYLTTTQYGAKYCSVVGPRLVGNMASYHRDTLP